MVTFVIVANLILALLCFVVAWQIWKIRRVLSKVADALTIYERNTHNVLQNAPSAILSGQTGTRQLRQQYSQLQLQLQQLQQILTLLSVGQVFWRQRLSGFRSRRAKKSSR